MRQEYLLPDHVESFEQRFRFFVFNIVFSTNVLHHGNDLSEVFTRHVREKTERETLIFDKSSITGAS